MPSPQPNRCFDYATLHIKIKAHYDTQQCQLKDDHGANGDGEVGKTIGHLANPNDRRALAKRAPASPDVCKPQNEFS